VARESLAPLPKLKGWQPHRDELQPRRKHAFRDLRGHPRTILTPLQQPLWFQVTLIA